MPEIRIVIINGPHEGMKMKTYPDADAVARHMRLPLPDRAFRGVSSEAREKQWRNELEQAQFDDKVVMKPSDIDRMVGDIRKSDDALKMLTHAAYEITGMDDNEPDEMNVARYRFLKEVEKDWHPRDDGLAYTEDDELGDGEDDF